MTSGVLYCDACYLSFYYDLAIIYDPVTVKKLSVLLAQFEVYFISFNIIVHFNLDGRIEHLWQRSRRKEEPCLTISLKHKVIISWIYNDSSKDAEGKYFTGILKSGMDAGIIVQLTTYAVATVLKEIWTVH